MNDHAVRRASPADADAVGRLLHDFNTEYSEPTPGPDRLAGRIRQLLEEGLTTVLVGGAGPDGLAVLRFRPAIWSEGLECYLAELYVQPGHRGQGLGKALMDATLETAKARGADYIEVATSEDDAAARALYEKFGFINREQGPEGPVMYVYEREL